MKKKLNLKDLKVESFVTNLDAGIENTVQGGRSGGACVPVQQYTTGCPKTDHGLDCLYSNVLCGWSKLC